MSLKDFLGESITSFTTIQQKLKEDGDGPVPGVQECIDFVIQLSKYQHKLQFSLPYKLFWDLSDNGPVYQMLKISLFNLKSLFSSTIWDKPEMDSFCSNLVLLMLNGIEAEGFWKRPQVFISAELAQSEKESLEKDIVKLGGIVAAKFTQSTTHILTSGKSKYENMRGNYRIEQEVDDKYQRHYCFKPDSEDQWTSEKPGKKRMKDILEEEPDQWNLSLDWLKDSATFNEWMNEFDYMKEAETRDVDFDSYESESVQSSDNVSEAYVDDDENDKDGEYEFDPEDADENELSGSEQNDSNASGDESPFAEDLDDLEDDMELIVEAKKMSSVFEWPVVIEVNLDRKIPVKLKPAEFEPVKDGIIANISMQFDPPAQNNVKSDAIKPEISLTKKDEISIAMLEELHGTVARDDFMQMHEWFLMCRQQEPSCDITISQLRKVVPEADIHLVCDIYELLHQKYPLNLNSAPILSTGAIYEFSHEKFNFPKRFECSVCKEDCWKSRYRSIKYSFYVICTSCFESGAYLVDLGSNEFYLEKGFGLDGNHRAEQQWDDESKLQLLEILQSTTDIKIIAEKMKKPRFEVWFNLVTLPSEYPFVGQPTYKTSDEILRALLGNAVNPITKLIDLLAVSVHPGLAAEAARIAMETILPKEVEALTTQDYWDISKLVWDGVIKKCSSLIKNEEIYIDAKMKELLELLVRRISIKSELLQAIASPYRDEPNPDQNDSTTQTAE